MRKTEGGRTLLYFCRVSRFRNQSHHALSTECKIELEWGIKLRIEKVKLLNSDAPPGFVPHTMSSAPVSPFRLSVELAGHSADVRALSARPIGESSAVLFSSSRDGTARSWVSSGSTANWREGPLFSEQHDGFVGAVEYINSINSDAPGGSSALLASRTPH